MEHVYITEIRKSQETEWNKYVYSHARGTLYHLAGWRRIIRNTYGHQDHYLMALKNPPEKSTQIRSEEITGILPLVNIKTLLFGSSLISVPFCDYGGILANDSMSEKELLKAAMCLAEKIGADEIELRDIELAESYDPETYKLTQTWSPFAKKNWHAQIRSHKVRMLLELPDSTEKLMNSFKSKLRSQIRKPMKVGLENRIGGLELLDDFYTVFTRNMKELGSPVHSKKIIKNVIGEFSEESRIMMVHRGSQPLAGSVVVGYKETLENPWASSLRDYSKLSPNMLLYWTMLSYGCEKKYKTFDFGRSSPGEGTYKFKEQWGAKPMTLHWRYISNRKKSAGNTISEDARFQRASQIWRKLPEPLTNIIGPCIRKYIGL